MIPKIGLVRSLKAAAKSLIILVTAPVRPPTASPKPPTISPSRGLAVTYKQDTKSTIKSSEIDLTTILLVVSVHTFSQSTIMTQNI